jgi:PPOX class probable FMN-dependent enzyme
MPLDGRFEDVITTEEELREVLGHPAEGAVRKVLPAIIDEFRDFIERSPFLLIASSDNEGNLDISPKGDPAGFVRVLDERTLAIPDRPGNRRGDTFSNIVQHPTVALFFLVPGSRETLRVQGRASIVRDRGLRESMAIKGKVPELAIVVEVSDAFLHCAKCVVRSGVWQTGTWPELVDIPSLTLGTRRVLGYETTREQVETDTEQMLRERLY